MKNEIETETRQLKQIRSQLRSISAHPDAIQVSIKNGEAILTGAAFEKEASQIELAVRSVHGITKVRSHLSLLKPSHNRQRILSNNNLTKSRSLFFNPRLPTALRLLLGTSGVSITLYGLRRRDIGGLFLAGIGLGAIIRAFTNIETSRLFGFILHPWVKLQRTIDVDAPVEVVFSFWKNFTCYSRFMSYVHDVKVNDKYGFTWTVVGPAGIPIHWDAQLTALIPNQLISWKSLPHALIMNSGRVQFKEGKSGNQTRIDVNLTYSPPAGVLGYEVIRILGFDPRARIDGDLLIMKTLIEQKYRNSIIQKILPFK